MGRAAATATLLLWTMLSATAAPGLLPAQGRAAADDAIDYLIGLHNVLADEHFHAGEFTETAQVLERVIELDPRDMQPYTLAAWVMWGRDKAKAEEYYARMVAAQPENPQAYFEVGQFYFVNQADYAKAAEWLAKATAKGMNINTREGHLHGHALRKAGRTGEAQAFWEECLRRDAGDEVAQRELQKLKEPPPPEEEVDPGV